MDLDGRMKQKWALHDLGEEGKEGGTFTIIAIGA
jgi:hypothetical protein